MTFELKPPNRLPKDLMKGLIKIFTAGSIEMGKAEKWQEKLVNSFPENDKVLFLNPLRISWDSSWIQDPSPGTKFHEQVTWELDHIDDADLVVFYFDPKTQSPVTLLEIGHSLGSDKTIIVCCPDGYFRKGNVVITCARHGVNVLNTFDDLVKEIKKYLKSK